MTRARRILVAASVAVLVGTGVAVVVGTGVAVPTGPLALAAGEQVSVHLTTTSDAGGRVVTRGLQAQAPVAFAAGSAAAGTTVTVDENVRHQQFEGGGASITDSTAHLLRGGPVSAATRDAVMRRLFHPVDGIGLSFVRNPMGASDLSRSGMTSLDDTCCSLDDFYTNGYDTNVRLLTQQAKQLNPALRVKGVPWSAPGWMKDNGRMDHMGWLKSEYYPMYAQYFVKYIQQYAAAGVKIDYISVQNEPNCCQAGNPTAMNYPGMSWNSSGLVEFTKNHIYPAFRAAGITTKVLVHDWNYGDYGNIGAAVLADAGVRNDPLFGGIAWHGYWGEPAVGSQVHGAYPNVRQFSTEHSGGTWIANQHNEDLTDIVSYGRNWSGTLVKWSLGLNQHMGPHNGGCGTCTGLITVQEGGARAGQVDYTVEYYTTGHLTKFVTAGAHRIESSDSATIRNIAYRNPDGSKALIAHNGGTAGQSVKVQWGSQSFTYTLPARTTATFVWSGSQSGSPPTAPPVTGPSGTVRSDLNGRCVDVPDNNSVNGQPMQLWSCHGAPNQTIQRGSDGTLRTMGKCLDAGGTGDGAPVTLWTCHGGANQQWTYTGGRDIVSVQADRCLDVKDMNPGDGARLQLWSCTGGANQKWAVP